MSQLLYQESDQTGAITHAADPGYDVVPGNVIKLAFVLLADQPFVATGTGDIKLLASWTAALAEDPAILFITKFIDNFTLPQSEPIAEGGNDATTWNAVRRLRGKTMVTATGMLSGVSDAELQAMKKLTGKSGNFQQDTRIGVIFLHEGKGIGAQANGKAFPAYNVFVSDPKMGGIGASFDVNFSFDLRGGWSDNYKLFAASDFTPSSLVNPAP